MTRVQRTGSWATLGGVIFLGIVLFWAGEYLPFQDLVGHAGLSALRGRIDGSPVLSRNFVLSPHLGSYALFRFFGDGLARVVGPLDAMRIFGALAFTSFPVALIASKRILFRVWDPRPGLIGSCLGLGLMTLLGFANFEIGEATAIVTWALLVRANVADTTREARRFAIIGSALAIVVMLWHGFALACLVAAFATSVLFLGRSRRWWTALAFLPAFLLAAYSMYAERTNTAFAATGLGSNHRLGFQGPWDKFTLLFSVSLMTRTGIDVVVAALLWVATAVYLVQAIRLRAWNHADPVERAILGAFSAFVCVFLAAPHTFGWFGFVDGRLIPLVIGFASLSNIESPPVVNRLRTWLLAVGPPALVLCNHACMRGFQSEARGFNEALARVPAGSRVLNLPIDPDSAYFAVHPYVHYDKLVLLDRDIVPSDVWLHTGTALAAGAENPVHTLPDTYSESNLKVVEWDRYSARDWDYALIRTRPFAPEPVVPPWATLEEHRGGWWLFRLSSPTSRSAAE